MAIYVEPGGDDIWVDPSQESTPGGDGGGGGDGETGACPDGTVPESIGSDGNWRTASPGECIDQAEFNRRVDLNIRNNPNPGSDNKPPTGSPTGTPPSGGPNYGKAPMFTAPQFMWGESWQAPTQAQAESDPGYQFGLNQGLKAMQQSAAARGHLLTGGTLKGLQDYGLSAARQQYGDVFNRNLQGYQTRYGTARDIYDRQYTGAKDEFAPRFSEWLQNAHSKDLGWTQNWVNYWKNNLSAQDIWNTPTY